MAIHSHKDSNSTPVSCHGGGAATMLQEEPSVLPATNARTTQPFAEPTATPATTAAVIAAAVAVFLGPEAKVRSIQATASSNPWARQGRVEIMSSRHRSMGLPALSLASRSIQQGGKKLR